MVFSPWSSNMAAEAACGFSPVFVTFRTVSACDEGREKGFHETSLRLHMVEMVSSHFGDAAVGRADVGRSGSYIPFVLPAVSSK